LTFSFAGSFGLTHTELERIVKKHGGDYSTNTKLTDVDYLVTTANAVREKKSQVQKALLQDIPIISEAFISDSILYGRLVDDEAYRLEEGKNKKKGKKPKFAETHKKDYDFDNSDDIAESDSSIDSDDLSDDQDALKIAVPIVNKKRKQEEQEPKTPVSKPNKWIKLDNDTVKKSPKPKLEPELKPIDFNNNAKPIPIEVKLPGENSNLCSFLAQPRIFSTGACGWSAMGLTFKVNVGGVDVDVQTSFNLRIPKRRIAASNTNNKSNTNSNNNNSESPSKEEIEENNIINVKSIEVIDEKSTGKSELKDVNSTPIINSNSTDDEKIEKENVVKESVQVQTKSNDSYCAIS